MKKRSVYQDIFEILIDIMAKLLHVQICLKFWLNELEWISLKSVQTDSWGWHGATVIMQHFPNTV